MALFSAGSSLTYHLAQFELNVITTSLPYSSSCTLPLSVLLSLPFPSTTTFTQNDDTLLFFSFHPLNFDSSISHFQNAFQHISSWMTANLLTQRLNSCSSDSKTNLTKIHNSSLDTSHSARSLGFSFDEHLTFSDQITALSKACYYHIR